MKFRTETGSIYELDRKGKRIRRLLGNHPPTQRQGDDGVWREYHMISTGATWVDSRMMIEWDDEGHCTLTSMIEQVWWDD